jgi:hypothetical protein
LRRPYRSFGTAMRFKFQYRGDVSNRERRSAQVPREARDRKTGCGAARSHRLLPGLGVTNPSHWVTLT